MNDYTYGRGLSKNGPAIMSNLSQSPAVSSMTAAELVAEAVRLKDHIEAEAHKFETSIKPLTEQLESVKNQLQAEMNRQGCTSVKTENGTAYISTIVSPSFADGDKIAFLDWCLEDWDSRGEMLQIGAPAKAPLKEWIESNGGELPPHVTTSVFTRVNITPRRS